MKRIAIVLLCALVALSLAACGSSSRTDKQAEQQAQQESKYYDVEITGAQLVNDDTVVVEFQYANKTNTDVAFFQAVVTSAYQDGVQLTQIADPLDNVGADGVTPDSMLKVQPGETATVHLAFGANNANDVTVKCAPGYVDGNYPMDEGVIAEQTFSF